jgi:hypothetical protein
MCLLNVSDSLIRALNSDCHELWTTHWAKATTQVWFVRWAKVHWVRVRAVVARCTWLWQGLGAGTTAWARIDYTADTSPECEL